MEYTIPSNERKSWKEIMGWTEVVERNRATNGPMYQRNDIMELTNDGKGGTSKIVARTKETKP